MYTPKEKRKLEQVSKVPTWNLWTAVERVL